MGVVVEDPLTVILCRPGAKAPKLSVSRRGQERGRYSVGSSPDTTDPVRTEPEVNWLTLEQAVDVTADWLR